ARAKRIAPLAMGVVAAFPVASKPEAFGDLAFLAPDGEATTLSALGGKVTLVNLWATWCVPCRSEMPALDRLEAARGGKDFAVAAINMDVTKPENAKQFLADIGVTKLAFYSDPKLGVFTNLKKRGLTIGLPTTLLVDAKGCRIGIMEGPAAWDSDDAKALISAAIPAATASG
ncbi:MAG TPA: TlpA disulfide reductase family protein, partial [Bauldia sp.]|nr:TlpA disulfide reductase family protein [Bauldia sp.]